MEQKQQNSPAKENWLKTLLILIVLTSFGYFGYSFWILQTQHASLEKEISIFNDGLSISQKNLTRIKSEYIATLELLRTEKQNNAYFEEKINSISSTVGVLEKLSKTDSELLKKYSKVYFLNENYIPPKLTPIPENYLFNKSSLAQIHSDVYPHLEKLLNDATASAIPIQIISAYRSFGTQTYLKSSYRITYGIGTANKFSADQGYSEHQLGTTVDFTTPKVGSTFVGFEKTDSYKWLLENAHKYGFIISYPKQNTFYSFEPWHWRYVGIDLATKLYDEKIYFYSLDQRVIDQYLVSLFD